METYIVKQQKRWSKLSTEDEVLSNTSSIENHISKIHILPINFTFDTESSILSFLSAKLKEMKNTRKVLYDKDIFKYENIDFLIYSLESTSTDNDRKNGIITNDTEFFFSGCNAVGSQSICFFEKINLCPLYSMEEGDETPNDEINEGELFISHVSPFLKKLKNSPLFLKVGDIIRMEGLDFKFVNALPIARNNGIVIPSQTTIHFTKHLFENTNVRYREFRKLHVLPFTDTLPNAYEYDLFNDYLKPFFQGAKGCLFKTNDRFEYHGVQFMVVCTDPSTEFVEVDGVPVEPRCVGRNTLIYCEGTLHPSLRNLLPPGLIEQLRFFPPQLQELLLNTELIASGDIYERLIELSDTFNPGQTSSTRGLQTNTIDLIEKINFSELQNSANYCEDRVNQDSCMVCLSDFIGEDEVRVLPCFHVFHTSCIDEWLRRCTDCPICKLNIDRSIRNY